MTILSDVGHPGHNDNTELKVTEFMEATEESLSCLSLSAGRRPFSGHIAGNEGGSYRSHSAKSASIHSLPVEILSSVLVLSQVPPHDTLLVNALDIVHGPWLLTHVSRQWQRVAISTPNLWSTIHVQLLSHMCPQHIKRVLRKILSRSGTLPLKFHLRGIGSSAHFWDRREQGECADPSFLLATDILLEHRARWSVVELHGPLEDIMPRLLAGGFPALQVLSLIDWAPLVSGRPDLSCNPYPPPTHFPCNICLSNLIKQAPSLGLFLAHAVFQDAGGIMQLANRIHGEWGCTSKMSIQYTGSSAANPAVVLLEDKADQQLAPACAASQHPNELSCLEPECPLLNYEGWLPPAKDGWTTVAAARTTNSVPDASASSQASAKSMGHSGAHPSPLPDPDQNTHCTTLHHNNAAPTVVLPCTSTQITDLTLRLSSGTSHTSHLPAFFAHLQLPNLQRVQLELDTPQLALSDVGMALGIVVRGMRAPGARVSTFPRVHIEESLFTSHDTGVDRQSTDASVRAHTSGPDITTGYISNGRGQPRSTSPTYPSLHAGLITALTIRASDSYGFPQVLLQLIHLRTLRLVELQGCTDVIKALGRVVGVLPSGVEDDAEASCDGMDSTRAAPMADAGSTSRGDGHHRPPAVNGKMFLCPRLTTLEIFDPPSLNLHPVHAMLQNRSKVAEADYASRLADQGVYHGSLGTTPPAAFQRPCVHQVQQASAKLERVVIRGGYVHPRAVLTEWVECGVVVLEYPH